MRLDERFAAELAALREKPAAAPAHLTGIREVDDRLQAWCAEHRGIGTTHHLTVQGMNAVVTEARAHDDQVHGVYRTDQAYRAAMKGQLPG